jgi:hypothetical protein
MVMLFMLARRSGVFAMRFLGMQVMRAATQHQVQQHAG